RFGKASVVEPSGCSELMRSLVALQPLLDAVPPRRLSVPERSRTECKSTGTTNMRLGNFSVSLAVKNLAASREFYEKLGFRVVAGNGSDYSILQNETSTIGLFQGMFDKNIMTFNPGRSRTRHKAPGNLHFFRARRAG